MPRLKNEREKTIRTGFFFICIRIHYFFRFFVLCRTAIEQKMTHTVRNTPNKYYIVYASTAWSTEQYTSLRRWFFSSWKCMCVCEFFWQQWWCRVGNADDDSNNNNNKTECYQHHRQHRLYIDHNHYDKYVMYHMSKVQYMHTYIPLYSIHMHSTPQYTQRVAHSPAWGKQSANLNAEHYFNQCDNFKRDFIRRARTFHTHIPHTHTQNQNSEKESNLHQKRQKKKNSSIRFILWWQWHKTNGNNG